MPKIILQKKELQKKLYNPIDDEVLKETISMIGTDIERFEDEIEVEIFPNRPDLLSINGLARAINAYLFEQQKTYHTQKGTTEVYVQDVPARAHTRCAIVRNCSINQEILHELIQIQEKLHITYGRNRNKVAIGIYPLDKITFPITYTKKKPEDIRFTPLEKNSPITGKEIHTLEIGKKYMHLLEGETEYPVFIDAKNIVLSVPPIINSKEAGEVRTDTKELFIEVTGHNEEILEKAINMLTCICIDYGWIVEETIIHYAHKHVISPQLKPTIMKVDTAYIVERSNIPKEEIARSLKKMGLEKKEEEVIIPPYRTDFMHPVDVIEDALIGYGYNNIITTKPNVHTVGALTQATRLHTKIRELLVGLQLQEVMNYALRDTGIELKNPLTTEYSCLRESLIEGLLDVHKQNIHNTYPQEIFEIGTVYALDANEETGVQEKTSIAVSLCDHKSNYTTIRQVVEYICTRIGAKIRFEAYDDPRFIEGRCAKISGDYEGILGEIHPEQLEKRKILIPISVCEFYKK